MGNTKKFASIAVIGGTGFYAFQNLEDVRSLQIETPFGKPSALLRLGKLQSVPIVFLARHGEHHQLLPAEINVRANIYALKMLGVERIISVSAVGSLRQEVVPGQAVLPDQFIDCTVGRPCTFFGGGVVAHVSLANPVCAQLHAALGRAARPHRVHHSGVYLCIEGPQFSTRAESELWRSWGAHVVGMTGLPEARLAREAEMCYAMLALSTDYDCWNATAAPVTAAAVAQMQRCNLAMAQQVVTQTVLDVADADMRCSCATSLDTALMTSLAHIDLATRERLKPILARRLDAAYPAF